jgi:hypothetical protein
LYDRVHRLINLKWSHRPHTVNCMYSIFTFLCFFFLSLFCLYNECYITEDRFYTYLFFVLDLKAIRFIFRIKNMNFIQFYILLIISISCFAGPLEDLANMPDLTLVSFENKFFCLIKNLNIVLSTINSSTRYSNDITRYLSSTTSRWYK